MRTTVEAAQSGDLSAFTELVLAYRGMASSVAWARTSDVAQAEEVVQEAFIDAWRLLPSLRQPSAFGAWLRSIVRKHADRVTRRRRAHAVPDVLGQVLPTGDGQIDGAGRKAVVRAAIEALPEHLRSVVRRFYLQGESVREIAEQLGLSISAVKKRLFDARRRLHPELEARMADSLPNVVRAFVAARTGDLVALRHAVSAHPELLSTTLEHDAERAAAYYLPGGGRLLSVAVEHGHADAVALLLSMGADPDSSTLSGTALHDAVMQDRPLVVEALLTGGAAVDVPQWHGGTALHLAAALGRPALVHRLLQAGADPAVANVFGMTAEGWAEERGHSGVISVLNGGELPTEVASSGRVVDPAGNPLDGGAALPAPERAAGASSLDRSIVPTEIKAVDLLAPLVRGGITRLVAGPWVGKTVLMGELAWSLGPPVVAAFLDRTWGVRDFEHVLRELGTWAGARVVMASGPDEGSALAVAALGHAEAMGTVLLADDRLVPALRAAAPRVPVVAFNAHVHQEPPQRDTAGQILLSAERSRGRAYPALDPEHSTADVWASHRHARLAQDVRRRIAQGGPVAERLNAYLTQPFHVAALFNGRSGVSVPLEQTLDDVEQILAGSANATAVDALRYVGDLTSAGSWPTHESALF